MMTRSAFSSWCEKLEFSKSSIEIIGRIRDSQPSRSVGGGSQNVAGTFPSKKMGVLIQFESHKVELPGLYIKEHDDSVLEMYDQPPRIKLSYSSIKDKVITIYHTPDFFVLYQDKAGWEEWKDEEELRRLSISSPNRYKNIDGCWRCPPGEAYAEQFGLHYWVKSSKDINWILQRNLMYLQDYLLDDKTRVALKIRNTILQSVKTKAGILLSDLLAVSDSDSISYLIARDELYVNLEKELLTEPERCHVFVCKETANIYHNVLNISGPSLYTKHSINIQVGMTVLWDGNECRILNIGHENISIKSNGIIIDIPVENFMSMIDNRCLLTVDSDPLECTEDKVNQILARASHNDLNEANRRYHIIKPVINGDLRPEEIIEAGVTTRTIWYWVKGYKLAEETWGKGFLGLIPKVEKRGNRKSRLPESTLEALDSFISENETAVNQSKRVLYWKFKLLCEEKGLDAPSIQTFYVKIRERPQVLRLLKTQGSRVAYQKEIPYLELDMSTPRHGERPFEIAHIDHTQVDIVTVHSQTGKVLGKAWLSIMMDAFSRRVLAFFLTYDEPSYRSDMMLIRECVRQFHRLPDSIVTDNGCDFRSVYFQNLMACFGITQKFRPCHKARFGSVGERLFGVAMEDIIHNLMGNTKIMKNVRQVTVSVNPETHAIWTLPLLYDLLGLYFGEIYDCREHSSLGQSPKDLFEQGIRNTGKRPYRHIAYNLDFLILTLPSIKRNNGTALVDMQRGVRVNNIYYNCDEFQYADMADKRVNVRYDPWDAGIVYSYVRDKWVVCYSQYYSVLKNRSEREIKIATQELLGQRKSYEKSRAISAYELARFISQAEHTEEMLGQRTRDIEMSKQLRLLTNISGSNEEEFHNSERTDSSVSGVNLTSMKASKKITHIFEDDFDTV